MLKLEASVSEQIMDFKQVISFQSDDRVESSDQSRRRKTVDSSVRKRDDDSSSDDELHEARHEALKTNPLFADLPLGHRVLNVIRAGYKTKLLLVRKDGNDSSAGNRDVVVPGSKKWASQQLSQEQVFLMLNTCSEGSQLCLWFRTQFECKSSVSR